MLTVEENGCRKATIEETMTEVLSEFSKKTVEERAFILIKGFFDAAEQDWNNGEFISDELVTEFHAWFNDPRNFAAIDKAMERMVDVEEERLWDYELSRDKCDLSSGTRQATPDIGKLTRIFRKQSEQNLMPLWI